MIPTPARVIRHRLGSYLVPAVGGFMFEPDVMRSGRWNQHNAEQLLPMLPAFSIHPDHLRIQVAPACGCCGAWRPRDIVWHSRRNDMDGAYRCTKHVDRLPCVIEGCGRTFGMNDDDTYHTSSICGRHWRMAPKRMRDLCALVRRRAKRRGWTDKLIDQHWRFWNHARRAIERRGDVGGEGHIDVAEIAAMFGFDD